jgi:hypothetical protein
MMPSPKKVTPRLTKTPQPLAVGRWREEWYPHSIDIRVIIDTLKNKRTRATSF